MRKKSPRRSFLKSTLALSGAGMMFPSIAKAGKQEWGGLSVRDLYDMCVDSAQRNENPTLLDEIIEKGVQRALEERGLSLQCPHSVVDDLLNKHKLKSKEGYLADLKTAIKNNKWGLRRFGQDEKWESACPWQDCPP